MRRGRICEWEGSGRQASMGFCAGEGEGQAAVQRSFVVQAGLSACVTYCFLYAGQGQGLLSLRSKTGCCFNHHSKTGETDRNSGRLNAGSIKDLTCVVT